MEIKDLKQLVITIDNTIKNLNAMVEGPCEGFKESYLYKEFKPIIDSLSPCKKRVITLANLVLELFNTPENTPNIDKLDFFDFAKFLEVARAVGGLWFLSYDQVEMPPLYAASYGDNNRLALYYFYIGAFERYAINGLPADCLQDQNYKDVADFLSSTHINNKYISNNCVKGDNK
jgi:hypothetical protein